MTFFSFSSLAQIELDSTIRIALEQNPKVDSIKYRKSLYKNGNVEVEGWVYYTSYLNLLDTTASNYTDTVPIGVSRKYFKNGDLYTIDSISANNNQISCTYHYLKNEQLFWVTRYKLSENPLKIGGIAASLNRTQNYHSTWYYTSSSQVKSTGNFINGKKVGLWKYYNKDGTLKKEKNFGAE